MWGTMRGMKSRAVQGRVAQIATDVLSGVETLRVEAVGVHLVAAVVVVALIDGLSQLLVEGA